MADVAKTPKIIYGVSGLSPRERRASVNKSGLKEQTVGKQATPQPATSATHYRGQEPRSR